MDVLVGGKMRFPLIAATDVYSHHHSAGGPTMNLKLDYK
jgi:hypothetical protein